LAQLLRSYQPPDRDRADVVERIISFVEMTPTCAERSHRAGHLTGSAWIVNPSRTRALLLHHRKLNKWMQPGGHADGELDLFEVALREAQEESGLASIHPVSRQVFDVDIHEIPQLKEVPPHYHYDVRFLFEADDARAPRGNDESRQVAWINFVDMPTYTEEESVLRMMRLSAL
jgi:8-oxo-dGTP pyrophosphatase MutT (NUDIX family)